MCPPTATASSGVAVREIVRTVDPGAVEKVPSGGGVLAQAVDHWVVLLTNPTLAGHVAYACLLVLVVALTQVKGVWRSVLLVPTLYLAAFTWENVLVENPSVSRLILLGALLVGLMNARPQGLFGTARIEIA